MKIIKSFRIEKELVDRLERQAKIGYESQTDIIENALRKYFSKQLIKQI